MNPIDQNHVDAINGLVLGYAISNLHIPAGMQLRVTITLVPIEVVKVVDETQKVHNETWDLEAKVSFLKCFPRSNRVANRLDFFNDKKTTVRDVFVRLKEDRYFRGIARKSKNQLWEWLNTLNINPGTKIPDEDV